MKVLLSAIAASMLLAGQALAQAPAPNPTALVHADSGVVQVQGAAVPLHTSAGAMAGDVISVKGQATVTYGNGCAVKIHGQYHVATTAPVCQTGTIRPENDGKYVFAGLGAAALVGLAVGGGGGGSDRPSSP
jgi:glycerol kinase